ncbi:hypothetical protein JX266_014267 [Neoarthrinium moseri]|nr:hypothetical protein JX266_014267 [Neoarthrinium moseri]
MRSSDVFTATSTPPGSPATQQTSRQSGHAYGSHGPTAADMSTHTTATSILKRSSTQSSNRFIRYKKAGFHGRAFLPNDEIERQRNLLLLDGWLHLSPVRPKKALDIGCGPGVCCLQLGKSLPYPDARVLGVDVDPVRASYHLPNCRFEVSDASQPWNYGGTFDFIHMRMGGELPIGKHKPFETIYEHLKPGVWVEITEWLIKFQSPKHSLDKFNIWNHAFKTCEPLGRHRCIN